MLRVSFYKRRFTKMCRTDNGQWLTEMNLRPIDLNLVLCPLIAY